MPATPERAKHTASKYDFVKVKVWLGEGMSHYYVLSRFLISRVLTVTKIPYMKAVKIALEVKKYLIDNDQFDVSQENLEAILFNVMESKGFGAEYTKRYKMVNQFHQERRPLIIIVCGAPCTGKSSLAQQLASRFNMPNVLQTNMFYELLRTSEDKPLHGQPLWERPDLDPAQLINEFQRECHVVRRSIDGDLVKTIRDGKSIIIEGLHLDPGLYLYEFGKYGIRHLHTRNDSLLPSQASTAQHDEPVPVNPEPMNPDAAVQTGAELEPYTRQAEKTLVPSLKPSRTPQEPKPGLLSSTQGLLQPSPGRQAASGGTGMLFALQSMANCMSPVLSSYGAHQPAQDQPNNEAPSDDRHGGQTGPAPLAHSPGSEWIAQQLQNACLGLAATLTSATESQPNQASRDTDSQDNQPDAQHAAGKANQPGHTQLHEQQADAAGSSHTAVPSSQDIYASQVSCQSLCGDGHSFGHSSHRQQQQQHCSTAVAQPGAAAGNEGTHTAHDLDQHREVPQRVAAAVALEGPEDSNTAQHKGTVSKDGLASSDAQTELDQPQVQQSQARQQETKKKNSNPTPVFVPIVVAMDGRDHKLLVEEWYSRQMALSGQLSNKDVSDKDMTDSANATYSRIRLLQDHLCTYAERNVPVIPISFANFSDTLDQLHDYLLQCIESAMAQC